MSCVRLFKKMLRGWKKEKGKLPIEVPRHGQAQVEWDWVWDWLLPAQRSLSWRESVLSSLSLSLPLTLIIYWEADNSLLVVAALGQPAFCSTAYFQLPGKSAGGRTDGRVLSYLFFFSSLSTLVPYTYPSSNDPPPSISLTYFSMQCAQTEAKTECRIENSYLCGHFFRLFNVSRSLPHSLPMLVSSVPVLLYYWSSIYLSFSVLFLLNK